MAMLVRPTAAWIELLRLYPSITKWQTPDRSRAKVMTEKHLREQCDMLVALGINKIILPYTSYFGVDFFPRSIPYFDKDTGRPSFWWAQRGGRHMEHFDPITAILDQAARNGQTVSMGINRAGDSSYTLDLFTTLSNFEPSSEMTIAGGLTVGASVTCTFNSESVLKDWADASFQIRTDDGGLIQIDGWNSLTSVTGEILVSPGKTVHAAYEWALTQADPLRFGKTVAERGADHIEQCLEDAARLHELYDCAQLVEWYVSPETAGIRRFCTEFMTPIIGGSGYANPNLASYGKDVMFAPGFTADIPTPDGSVRADVVAAIQGSLDVMPDGTTLRVHGQSALGPKLSIKTFEPVGVSYGEYEFGADYDTLIEQRKDYFAQYRAVIDSVGPGAQGAAISLGSVEELWRMDGPLYRDEYPNDIDPIQKNIGVVSDAGVDEISIYASFGFMDPGDRSLRLMQENYQRTDYYTRANRLWDDFGALCRWMSGLASVSHVGLVVYVKPVTGEAVRFWLGVGDLPVFGDCVDASGGTYLGIGAVASLPELQGLLNGQAERVDFTLSGLDATVTAMFDDESPNISGARLNIGVIVFSPDNHAVSPPQWIYEARIDAMRTGRQGQTLTMSVSAGTAFTSRRRGDVEFYSPADQRQVSAGDTFCDLIPNYSRETTVRWPS